MKRQELTAGIFHLRSGSNMGLIVRDGKALLVDAGLDDDAGRRALRIIEEMDVRLEAVFITHAHADHFGGAHFLQRRLGVPVYAPALEASMMESPIVEPLYLFSGAAPIEELRSKFTLAEPCRVDHVVNPGPLAIGPFQLEVMSLPGHAPQPGRRGGGRRALLRRCCLSGGDDPEAQSALLRGSGRGAGHAGATVGSTLRSFPPGARAIVCSRRADHSDLRRQSKSARRGAGGGLQSAPRAAGDVRPGSAGGRPLRASDHDGDGLLPHPHHGAGGALLAGAGRRGSGDDGGESTALEEEVVTPPPRSLLANFVRSRDTSVGEGISWMVS